ncbi:MAG: RNA polymerase sigma factor [Gemmatimonadaceae bacterium]
MPPAAPPLPSSPPERRDGSHWTTHDGIDLDDLVRRARAGESRAVQQLVDHLTPIFHRHALQVTGAPDVADDIVQQAFVTAHQRLAELEGRFDGWVFRIVSNLCKDHLRNIRTTSHDSYESDDLVSPRPTPDRQLERAELREALVRALGALPAHYREVFVRHHLHDESYEAIGRALGTTPGAIKMRVHRAKAQLQDLLAAYAA